MAHPWRSVIGVSAILLTLAIPLLSIETGTQALSQFPKGSDVRVGNELASQAARRRRRPGADRRLLQRRPGPRRGRRLRPAPASDAGRRLGVSARFAGESALIEATPTSGSESDAARALVERLRDTVVPASGAEQRRHRRRRRRDRPQPGRPRPDHRLDVEDRPLRAGAQLPRPDGDAALAAAAAEGGPDEPALDRRRVRRPRRRLPVGLVRQPARLRKPGRARHDQRAADLRDRLRPLDGLRGLPHVAHPRALRRPRRQRAGRRRGPLLERPHDLLGGVDHDLGLLRLRPHRRAVDQGARPRLRGRDRARRDAGPPDPGARRDEAARRLELVDALLARPGPAATSPSRTATRSPPRPNPLSPDAGISRHLLRFARAAGRWRNYSAGEQACWSPGSAADGERAGLALVQAGRPRRPAARARRSSSGSATPSTTRWRGGRRRWSAGWRWSPWR